jgi:FdhD protein
MPVQSRDLVIDRTDGASSVRRPDVVAVEEPLEIQVSSADARGAAAKSVSITMRTPGHDAELATGFLFTEGIISSPGNVLAVTPVGEPVNDAGLRNTIRVELSADTVLDLDRLQRHFYTTSSCGVCGKASLDALRVAGAASLAGNAFRISPDRLVALSDAVRENQPVFRETGGLHAAAAFDADGKIRLVREDVGRHNATDKLIGALLAANEVPGEALGIFVSGRASFELMQKTLVAGIPLLAAVGAPSSLAVDTALEFGMTLVGFLRDGSFNTYAGGKRIG